MASKKKKKHCSSCGRLFEPEESFLAPKECFMCQIANRPPLVERFGPPDRHVDLKEKAREGREMQRERMEKIKDHKW